MKKFGLHWMIPLLIAAVLFFGCGRKPGEKLYTEALTEWKAGNHVRARALLEKSIRRRAGSLENADAYNRLGLLLWEMGDFEASAEAFSESCRVDAGQFDVLCNLGVALSAIDDLPAAEQAFREAALMKPDDPRPLAFAGIVFLRSGKWAEAAQNLRLAVQRNPSDPRLQTALALAELHTTGADTALRRLQSVAQKHPSYAPALFNTATITRFWLQNPTGAKRWLELYLKQASGIDKFSAPARTRLQEGVEIPAGLDIPDSQSPDRERAEALFRSALVHHKAGRLEQAEAGYREALKADSTYEQAFYNLGLVCYSQDRMPDAAEAFERAVQLNPAFIAARYNLALTAHRLGDKTRALRELKTILEKQPNYQPAIDLLERLN